MIWFVYLLKCVDDTLYCGITNDIEKRINKHNSKKGAKYTRSRVPVELYYYEEYSNKSEALKREYQVKKLSRSEKISLKEKNSPK